MIQYAKLTGRTYEGRIEVLGLHGITLLARPVLTFPLIALPSEEWLQKWGNQFQAVVDYEQDKPERALFMGLVPLEEHTFPENATTRQVFVVGEKFRLTLDDEKETFTIEQLQNAQQSVRILPDKVVTTSKHIFHGDQNASEPMLLGGKTVDLVADFLDAILKLTVPTAFGPSGVPINSPVFAALKNKLSSLKSQVNKLT